MTKRRVLLPVATMVQLQGLLLLAFILEAGHPAVSCPASPSSPSATNALLAEMRSTTMFSFNRLRMWTVTEI